MKNTFTTVVLLSATILTLALGAIFYPQLPEFVASHWNADGVADDYSPKAFTVFLFPAIMAILFVTYLIIPKIDPLKENLESFRAYYNLLWALIFAFLFYIFALFLVWNLGYEFDFAVLIIPAVAVLWYVVGIIIGKSKRNWFVGIRTPWTLSSDVVWEKTHKLGGALFKLAALIALAGFFLRDSALIILTVIAPVVLILIVTVFYSFIEYMRQER